MIAKVEEKVFLPISGKWNNIQRKFYNDQLMQGCHVWQ
jgi:hypothetical protein